MCVIEDSMPPSISVTREQEVWGEYGLYTAYKHNYLFKIIQAIHLKVPEKEVQIPPKSSPRDHLEPKNHSDAARTRKKPILGGRVRHRARQRDPKVNLQTGPRAPKSKIYVLYQKSIVCGVSLESTEAAFGG